MPPLGIFSRGRSPSPGPVEHRQDVDSNNINLSVHGDSDQKRTDQPTNSNAPLRGIFRGLGSSRHAMNESVHKEQVHKIPMTPSAKVVDEKAEMEKEYLNIINALSKEQHEARDEIMRRVKETSDLSASKKELESKVSELEAKYEKLKKESELRDKAASQDEDERKERSQMFTFHSGGSTNNLEMIKEKLREHRESNEEMNTRVQRLRDKYARRRAQADDMSETSSVVSSGTIRTTMSAATTPYNIRHNIADVKRLQKYYENEQKRNEELKEAIKHIEEEKMSLESRLKDVSAAADEKQKEKSDEIEGLKLQLAAERSKHEEREKALDDLTRVKDSLKSGKDKEITSLRMKLTEQSIKIAELQNEINSKEDELIKLKNNGSDTLLQEKMQESQLKLTEQESQLEKLRSELTSVRQELEEVRSNKISAEVQSNKNDTEKHKLDEDSARDKAMESLMEEKTREVQELEKEVSTLKAEIAEMETLKSELSRARDKVQKKDEELSALRKEYETSKKNLNELESDFVSVQEKNARTFQELEDIREKYESQMEKYRQLQEAVDKKPDQDPVVSVRLHDAEENITKLKEEIQQKEKEIASYKAQSAKETSLHQQFEGLKLEMASLKLELANKKEELQNLREEKTKSSSQLETIQQDMLTIQLKSSATFDELEDLKDKYDKEIQEKMSLKEQLEKFSPEEILAQAKKENETELKHRDSEIHALKKQLTDANVAKTEIELRLMEVMNDVVASQSTRDLMKNELESRLDEENEKAEHLELLIRGKEEDMERMRKEFEDLRIKMEKETDMRRKEITNLNGEVVEKSSLLSSRERDFVQLKVDMDELKLKHQAEVASLKKQIDEFGANEKEVQRVHRKNVELQSEIASLKNEIRRLHMNGNGVDELASPQSSVRVLRTRNEELKGEVEKLQRKLRHMKRNVTRIEL